MMQRFFSSLPCLLLLVLALAACGGGGDDAAPAEAAEAAADPEHGAAIYQQSCALCHGKDAQGIPPMGNALVDNAFVQRLDDEAMVEFLLEGRPGNHPDNKSGVLMPPKGGDRTLTRDDLYDVVAFMRTLQPE